MTDARLQKDVRFFSHGARIAGVLRLPAGNGPHPVVVMCTGMTLTKEVWLPANAEWLCERGHATLNFDYRGWGESEGPRQQPRKNRRRRPVPWRRTGTLRRNAQIRSRSPSWICTIGVALPFLKNAPYVLSPAP